MSKLIIHTGEFLGEAEILAESLEQVQLIQVFGVADFLQCLRLRAPVQELHVLAEAGVYGFYLGQDIYPEQVSRADWFSLSDVFPSEAEIHLHHQFADRWLARYLSNLFGLRVNARSVDEGNNKWFEPDRDLKAVDQTYDSSAALYDEAFSDITVRQEEWRYVTGQLEKWINDRRAKPSMVEIGCGNGQMLRQLLHEGFVSEAVGLDASSVMIEKALERTEKLDRLTFKVIEGAKLEIASNSADVIMSFMSFRYLDWEPMMQEVRRVLKPGGKFIMVDMAETILSPADEELYQQTKAKTAALHRQRPQFAASLKRLVEHPEWQLMLKYHPKRLASEYQRFLSSRFPAGEWSRLYVCFDHSLFGFNVIV